MSQDSQTMTDELGYEQNIDTIMYCLAALENYQGLPPEKIQAVAYEIAMLGRGGLDIEDTDKKYILESLPGKFTAIQLMAYLYVGLKQTDPDLDPGVNLQDEYKTALEIFKNQGESLK